MAAAEHESPPRPVEPVPTRVLAAMPVAGRLGMLTGAALLAGTLPLPVLPDRMLLHLRGAVAHDTAARHAVSLATDARQTLAQPSSSDRMRAVLRRGFELLVRQVLRRLGPLAPLSAAARAFEVYALGHLLDRYLRRVRRQPSLRMQQAEAAKVRLAIDEAVIRAFYPSTRPQPLHLAGSAEDLRDEFTRWVDTLLLAGATLPSYLERRLEAAFDEVAARMPGLGGE
jgi:hypothetical protein